MLVYIDGGESHQSRAIINPKLLTQDASMCLYCLFPKKFDHPSNRSTSLRKKMQGPRYVCLFVNR
jgi:hypothetical protein